MQALFGYTAAEVGQSGAWWKANIHPDDRARVTARIAAVIEGAGETWSDEYRFRRVDGTYADVFDRGTVIRDDAGRACRMIGAMLDLSERKRAAEALRLAEERLRMAVQSAAIGTWDYDPTSDRLRWDARCKELFGLPPGAEGVYEGAFLAGLHPEDRARTQEAVAAALDPRGPGEYDIEYRTIGLTDGIERWIRAKGKAFFEGNTATRFIGTVIDVSDRKRVEELLRDTVARQELMMGELSHRAKNNLALIAGLLGAQGRASSHPRCARRSPRRRRASRPWRRSTISSGAHRTSSASTLRASCAISAASCRRRRHTTACSTRPLPSACRRTARSRWVWS